MNELQIFNNSKYGEMRTTEIDGATWFCLADICRPLGIQASDCRKRLNPEGVDTIHTLTSKGMQAMLFVNESNFYKAVFQSKKQEAEEFTEWVTSEVLPSIRKHGAYITARADPAALRQKADELESVAVLNQMAGMLIPMFDELGMQPAFKLLAMKQIYRKAGIDIPMGDLRAERELYDLSSIARKVGILAESGKPHERAVGAIIKLIGIPDAEKELVSFEKQGHMGTTYQYTAMVIDKVRSWVESNQYPDIICATRSNGKFVHYKVKYSQTNCIAVGSQEVLR